MPSYINILNHLLKLATRNLPNPRLPEWLFLVGTYFFPQVNIEVIVRVNLSSLIYTWRDDNFGNRGWHIPGSIIRPNDMIDVRIRSLITNELQVIDDCSLSFPKYVGFSQVLADSRPSIRSHFISHVFVLDVTACSNTSIKSHDHVLISSEIPRNLIANHIRHTFVRILLG